MKFRSNREAHLWLNDNGYRALLYENNFSGEILFRKDNKIAILDTDKSTVIHPKASEVLDILTVVYYILLLASKMKPTDATSVKRGIVLAHLIHHYEYNEKLTNEEFELPYNNVKVNKLLRSTYTSNTHGIYNQFMRVNFDFILSSIVDLIVVNEKQYKSIERATAMLPYLEGYESTLYNYILQYINSPTIKGYEFSVYVKDFDMIIDRADRELIFNMEEI